MSATNADIDRFLNAIYHEKGGVPTSNLKRIAMTASHPMIALAAIRHVMEFPVVEVDIPKSDRGRARWIYDPRRPWRFSGFISSYMEIPSPLRLYWQGQAKQNVRKSTERAKVSGFKVKDVEPLAIRELISQVFSDSGWTTREIEDAQQRLTDPLDGAICVAVFDEREHPVAFCLGIQAGEIIRNIWAYTSQRGTVRWLCFSGYVEEVSSRGARFIIESAPWAFTGGNEVFAAHLGFKPARIRCK